jgi:hypothetical protein
MLASIPDGPWQVAAHDPTALTRLLHLPGLFVTGLKYDPDHACLHVFCQHQSHRACCPTWAQISVTTPRRQIQRESPEEVRAHLKGCRWRLVRNEVDLSDAQKACLQTLFLVARELGALHTLKEQFRAIFEGPLSRELTNWRLFGWIGAVERSGLAPLMRFVGTRRRRLSYILNYFPARLSNGRVEGLNPKIKVIKRSAYGFCNFVHFALRVQVECDGAPSSTLFVKEPNLFQNPLKPSFMSTKHAQAHFSPLSQRA